MPNKITRRVVVNLGLALLITCAALPALARPGAVGRLLSSLFHGGPREQAPARWTPALEKKANELLLAIGRHEFKVRQIASSHPVNPMLAVGEFDRRMQRQNAPTGVTRIKRYIRTPRRFFGSRKRLVSFVEKPTAIIEGMKRGGFAEFELQTEYLEPGGNVSGGSYFNVFTPAARRFYTAKKVRFKDPRKMVDWLEHTALGFQRAVPDGKLRWAFLGDRAWPAE